MTTKDETESDGCDVDGKFNTSSGVSAGIDMARDIVSRRHDERSN
jgi:transcriptional regulator GlxA family with amidase domain